MSLQPMMQIPRASRVSGRIWLAAVLAPLLGLLAAYLVALISLVAAPSWQEMLRLSDQATGGAPMASQIPEWVQGTPSTTLTALILLMTGLVAPIEATVSVISNFGFPLPVQIQLLTIPLTLTATVAVVIFFVHRVSCRKVSQSPLLLWIPALVSALVLSGTSFGLAQFTSTRIVITPPEEAGVAEIQGINMTSELNLVWLVIATLALGLAASFIGRLNAIPARRASYASTSTPTFTPSIAHGIRISFSTLLLSFLATSIYMAVYALLKMEDDVPVRVVFYVLPYLLNLGIVTTLGSLGGFGVWVMNAPGELADQDPTGLSGYEKVREQVLQGAPWTIWIMAVFVVLALIIGGIRWARTRDPRRERGFVSWIILPVSFAAIGSIAIALNMAVFSGAMLGERLDLTVRMSWLSVGWFFAMGLFTEVVARIARPRTFISTPAPGYSVAVPQPLHSGQQVHSGQQAYVSQHGPESQPEHQSQPAQEPWNQAVSSAHFMAPPAHPDSASLAQSSEHPQPADRQTTQMFPNENHPDTVSNQTQPHPPQNSETETHND